MQVNQRVAAHKDRKLIAVPAQPENNTSHTTASARAAAAAARVAARYAQAPSYSELLAGEARAAVRAAEAVSRAAQEAQAVAESVLAGIEAAAAAEPAWAEQASPVPAESNIAEPEWVETSVVPEAAERSEWISVQEEFEARWEQDWPVKGAEPRSRHAAEVAEAEHGVRISEVSHEDLRVQVWAAPQSDEIGMVEPAQPIHANLIEFPREIVATRKVRPRLAEGPLATAEDQLSIFEVDPSTVSTVPVRDASTMAAAPAWSGIELDATPAREYCEDQPEDSVREIPLEEQLEQAKPNRIRPVAMAPIHLRVMAAIVDGSLVVCGLLGAALLASVSVHDLPTRSAAEASAAIGLALIGAFYHLLFYALGDGTPGMRYARILPCTFDGRSPSRLHRIWRLLVALVALAPLGLGMIWALFDEEHLGWHDRLSGTYLRKV